MKIEKRSGPAELPSGSELREILEKEAIRLPPRQKLKIHYPDFHLFYQWMELLRLDTTVMEAATHPDEVLQWGSESLQRAVGTTIANKDDASFKDLFVVIARYLGEEDHPAPVDAVMVFGGSSLKRIEKGVELLRKGIANRLIISGGNPNYRQNALPEAIKFLRYTLANGVPKDAILMELNSISIPDNVKTTLNLLDNFGVRYRRLAIVLPWFAQRRGWAHMMKFSSPGVSVLRVNSEIISQELLPTSWFTNEMGIKLIFNEFVKMKVAVLLNTA